MALKQEYIKGQREVVTNCLNDTEKYSNIRIKNVFIGFGNYRAWIILTFSFNN